MASMAQPFFVIDPTDSVIEPAAQVLADPMPLDEALAVVKRVATAGRAIQRDIDQIMAEPNNVADHNPHDIPSPGQVAAAAGVSITNAISNMEKVRERVEFMTGLVDQMQMSLVKLWELLKGLDDKATERCDEDFYHGIIAALAVVELHGFDTVFDNIVDTLDRKELLRVARRNGDMRWSGLSRYVRRHRQELS